MSEVSICNNALREIGALPITSFGDNTLEAELCAEFYPTTRDELIADYPWSFALKRVSLAMLEEIPLYGYGNKFQLPGDLLRLWKTDIGGIYTVEGDTILTNNTSVNILYIAEVIDPNLFPPLFRQALITSLMSKLVFPITKREGLSRSLMEKALSYLENAKSADAQQTPGPRLTATTFIDVRTQGSPYRLSAAEIQEP